MSCQLLTGDNNGMRVGKKKDRKTKKKENVYRSMLRLRVMQLT